MMNWFKDTAEVVRYLLKRFFTSRLLPLTIIFLVMFGALVYRLFDLQILQGEDYQVSYLDSTRREVYTSATRGNIYDRNGVLLAYNELTYSVTVTDNGEYETGYEKNKMLLELIRLLGDYDVEFISEVPLGIADDGTVFFTSSSTSSHRSFLRDFYHLTTANDLDKLNPETGQIENPSDITAREVYDEYIEYYGIGRDGSSSTAGTYDYTPEEGLELINMRVAMSASSYRKYEAVTLATGLSTEAMVAVQEAAADLAGIGIEEQTIRVYNDAYEFAHILGYTGKASSEELETLQEEAQNAGVADLKLYSSGDVVGKSGIEQSMELELSGTKGSSVIYVDSEGRIVETESTTEAVAGNDVYLSIDRDLQVGVYHLLEQMIAGILVEKIQDVEPDSTSVTSDKNIPVKRVYYQLIGNNILSMSDFSADEASETEKGIYQKMSDERSEIMYRIRYELTRDDPLPYNEMDENYQSYMSTILSLLKDKGYILEDRIDTSSEEYAAWSEGTISLKEYLYDCISMNWVDTTSLGIDEKYPSADYIYEVMLDTVMDILETNTDFCKKIYEILIYDGTITGRELCLALFEQGVLEWNDSDVEKLRSGSSTTAYYFIKEKIESLEITPAQLALTPCSGSVVITDLDTGEVLALVSYPSYDINRLSGTVDADYYNQLLNDASTPLYNIATQELRAPGSVFKMVTAAAALEEGVINLWDTVYDTGIYTQFDGEFTLRCWNTAGHGSLNLVSALGWSCNYFFCEMGYRLSLDENGEYSSALGLATLQEYASLFGFDSKSGIEIYESTPSISDESPIASAIGQGSNAFANIHLARYVTAIATRGKMYDLTLIDRVTDSSGELLEQHEPEIEYIIDLKDSTWDALQEGMNMVVTTGSASSVFTDCVVSLGGKTGTAQEDTSKPNHARFVGFAPYEDPEIGISITIPNGYTGTNAAYLAKSILSFYYGETTLEDIINNGEAIEAYGGSQRD